MKKKKQKIYAFIDSKNVDESVKAQGWGLDWKRFRIYLEDKYGVDKALFFIGYVKKYGKLYKFLRKAGYVLVFKPTVSYRDRRKKRLETKGNVDAELVLHAAAIEFDNYDKAVIVSGDGDFRCLVEWLRKKKKFKKLLIPNKYRFSALLRKFIKCVDYMNDLKSKLKYEPMEIKKERH